MGFGWEVRQDAHQANALAQGQDEDGKAPQEQQAGEGGKEGVDADAAATLRGGGRGGHQEDGGAQRQGPQQGIDQGPDQGCNEVQVVGDLVGREARRAAMTPTALSVRCDFRNKLISAADGACQSEHHEWQVSLSGVSLRNLAGSA